MNDSQHRTQARLFRVGLMTTVGFVIFGAVVVSIGTTQGIFSTKLHYQTYFRNIGGLSEGAPVKLSGVPVGSVEAITFSEDIEVSDIRIDFSVGRDKAVRIRVGTQASLKSLSLLSGEKYIELTPGDPKRPQLEAGSTIPADEKQGDLSEIGGAATDVAAEVVKIADNLNRILVTINEGEGLLGRVVSDPEFGKPTLDALYESLEQIRIITERIQEGDTFAGKLMGDTEYGDRLAGDLLGTLESLRSVADKIDRGDGLAAEIVNDPESGPLILENLAQATDDLRAILDEIREGKGLAAKLLYDEEYGERVSNDLAETVSNLRSISEKVDRGEGSLGQALNDPGLYASLDDVVSGVNKSKILGWVIRRYQKKGFKERATDTVNEEGPEQGRTNLEQTYGEEIEPRP